MKYKYRAQLNSGKMVDIFDFEDEYALCDHKAGKVHIDEINSVIMPRDTFKIDVLKMEVLEPEIEVKPQPKKKKNS